ncbi:MAG: hypothetical protein ACR2NS_14755 [Gemmatimonadaceae bacterium]
MRGTTLIAGLLAAIAITACGSANTTSGPPGSTADTAKVPLTDMTTDVHYRGFAGGLYPGGNALPAAHQAAGIVAAKAIKPLDANGAPSPSGRYVLLSIGMSNTTQEFCAANAGASCASWSFMGQAAADPAVNRTTLAIVNGARGGQAASDWTSPTSPEYDRIRDTVLATAGLSEQQVQIAWVKVANAQPTVSLPSASSDAYMLVSQMATIARTLKLRYPNLRQIFFSSRTYAGYATTSLNPEPYAYESGLAVKWVVQAQIDQMQRGSEQDARAGDLNYQTVAPWIGWGPYLWTRGTVGRADGLVWTRADVESDGTHPSQSGEQKVGRLLLDFFKTSPVSRCWFLAGEVC